MDQIREIVRRVEVAQRPDLLADDLELVVGRSHPAQVHHTHIHIVRPAGGVDTDNPETEDIGSGIYSEYRAFLSSQLPAVCQSILSNPV